MSGLWGHLAGGFIVVMMVVFIGIWVWAWLPHHRRTFDDLARLPMEDLGAAAAQPGNAPRSERRDGR